MSLLLFCLIVSVLCCPRCFGLCLPNNAAVSNSHPGDETGRFLSRRALLVAAVSAPVFLEQLLPVSTAACATDGLGAATTVVVEKAGDRVGLELYDVILGDRSVVAIKRIIVPNSNNNKNLQTGMVLQDFVNAVQVQERLQNGPFPVRLVFRNLAAGGDALSDVGTPLVTAQDALDLARSSTSSSRGNTVVSDVDGSLATSAYRKTIVKSSPCPIRSRRLDVLEVVYEARIGGPHGPVYDSSLQRGTGQPYQMVLGSGDMLAGVDQGLYDMCPGDVRTLDIPPQLAYGPRGNKLFGIPANASLYWTVELVSVNSVEEGDKQTRDEMEQRVQYF